MFLLKKRSEKLIFIVIIASHARPATCKYCLSEPHEKFNEKVGFRENITP